MKAAGSNSANQTRGLGGTGRTGVEGSSRSGDGGNGGQNGISPENGDNPSSLQGPLQTGVGGLAVTLVQQLEKKWCIFYVL